MSRNQNLPKKVSVSESKYLGITTRNVHELHGETMRKNYFWKCFSYHVPYSTKHFSTYMYRTILVPVVCVGVKLGLPLRRNVNYAC